MASGRSLEQDERIKNLIELARRAPTDLTPERLRRIRQGLLQRLERDRIERLWREQDQLTAHS